MCHGYVVNALVWQKKGPDKKFHCVGISLNVTNTVQ